LRPFYRQLSDAVPCVFDENQDARFQIGGTLSENCREPLIDRFRSFVSQPENDHTRFVEHAERKHIAEVEIEGENDARISAGALDNLPVGSALHPERSNMYGFMTELHQKLNGEGREPRIGQEAHLSRAKRV